MQPLQPLLLSLLFLILAAGGCATRDLALERQQAYQSYQNGEFEQAAGQFQRLVEAVPKDAELWFRLGNSYARAQQPKNAIMAYENALLRDPAMSKAWYNMGLIHLRAAVKAFADMQQYGGGDDPAVVRGERMRKGLFSLLEGSADDAAQED